MDRRARHERDSSLRVLPIQKLDDCFGQSRVRVISECGAYRPFEPETWLGLHSVSKLPSLTKSQRLIPLAWTQVHSVRSQERALKPITSISSAHQASERYQSEGSIFNVRPILIRSRDRVSRVVIENLLGFRTIV